VEDIDGDIIDCCSQLRRTASWAEKRFRLKLQGVDIAGSFFASFPVVETGEGGSWTEKKRRE
jgi:hypothetical protein